MLVKQCASYYGTWCKLLVYWSQDINVTDQENNLRALWKIDLNVK